MNMTREHRVIDSVFKLLDIPFYYYLISLVIGVVVGRAWRWEGGLLVGYAFLLLAETVLIRYGYEGQHFQPELFWSWRVWNAQKNQILANIVMFSTVGILAGLIWKWRGLLVAAGMSVVYELLQLITARGLCEFDDLIHNTFGALVGMGLYFFAARLHGDNR